MKTERNIAIDAAKLLFAFSVVFVHLVPNQPLPELMSRPLVTFTVPFFISIALYFFLRKVMRTSELTLRELNFERLLIPYIVWTAIYVGLRILKYRTHTDPRMDSPLAIVFYGEGALHLYFLPFLLLCEAWVLSLALFFRSSRERLIALFISGGALAFSYVGAAHVYMGFDNAVLKSILYVALAFLLYALQNSTRYAAVNTTIAGLLALFLFGASLYYPFDGWPQWLYVLRGPIAGYAAASLVLSWRPRRKASKTMAYLLGYSYGIYLMHLAFIGGLELMLRKLDLHIIPYSAIEKAFIALCICLCCMMLIALIRMNSFTKLVLLGEPSRPARSVLDKAADPKPCNSASDVMSLPA